MTADKRPLAELGSFLRARRMLVDPKSKGLPIGNRRAPGLRREEVAILASISPSWYTYLEQGRDIRPSESVLNALADVLDLAPAERRYITLLALGGAPHRDQPVTDEALEAATELVRSVDPLPAYAATLRGDVFAWNEACAEWLVDFGALPMEERNIMLWSALHPLARVRLVDWELEIRDQFGRFRAATASQPDDPRIRAVVAKITGGPEQVRTLWDNVEISDMHFRLRRLRHPSLGTRDFRLLVLLIAGVEALGIAVHQPIAPSQPSAGGPRRTT